MKNNWYIITGAPCSGKTTLLKVLEKKGYKVIYEAARTLIDRELKKGKTLDEVRKNELEFQKKVLQFKIDIEKSLPKKQLTFLERGIPDSISYFKIYGVKNDKRLVSIIKKLSYKKVFLLESFAYQKDYARIEDIQQVKKIEEYLFDDYKKYGFNIIKVPKMTVGKRIDYIFKSCDLLQ